MLPNTEETQINLLGVSVLTKKQSLMASESPPFTLMPEVTGNPGASHTKTPSLRLFLLLSLSTLNFAVYGW